MILDDLDGKLFADVPQAASILGLDERTVRKAAAAGEIPAEKIGAKWMIRTAWLRDQAGNGGPPTPTGPDLDELAERITEKFFTRFARMFGTGSGPGEAV